MKSAFAAPHLLGTVSRPWRPVLRWFPPIQATSEFRLQRLLMLSLYRGIPDTLSVKFQRAFAYAPYAWENAVARRTAVPSRSLDGITLTFQGR